MYNLIEKKVVANDQSLSRQLYEDFVDKYQPQETRIAETGQKRQQGVRQTVWRQQWASSRIPTSR